MLFAWHMWRGSEACLQVSITCTSGRDPSQAQSIVPKKSLQVFREGRNLSLPVLFASLCHCFAGMP